MELFKFVPGSSKSYLDRGEIINNLDSITWIERYYEPGEFTIESQLSGGIMETLPLGTIISHVDSLEAMIVESHEIKEKTKDDPTITITGRSFTSYLEHRIVGTNLVRAYTGIDPYILAAQKSWLQIVHLINDHIDVVTDPNDRLYNFFAAIDPALTALTGEPIEERTIPRGVLLDKVTDLLAIDELGIKTVRKNTFGIVPDPPTYFMIYKGIDKSSDIAFSWKAGDLDGAEYLFTQKNMKTSAMVVGQYTNLIVDLPGYTQYDRRMMIVDGTDLDGHYAPTDDFSLLLNAFRARGTQALKKQRNKTITRADTSMTSQYDYRRDYNMGDLVTVAGNYGAMSVMRVTEFAEIQDENGESSHPTLSLPEV